MAKDMPHWRGYNEFDFSDDYNRAGGAELWQKTARTLATDATVIRP